MIDSNFALTSDDIEQFKELKNSTAYKEYIQSQLKSPMFLAIVNEHIKTINIKSELETLEANAKLNAAEVNNILKNTLKNMTIGIQADTIILKEFSDLRIADAEYQISDIHDEMSDKFMATYLAGLAPERYYIEAEQQVQNEQDTNSIVYKGLIEYKRRNNILKKSIRKDDDVFNNTSTPKPSKDKPKPSTSKKRQINTSSLRL